MKGIKYILAGIGFILFSIASIDILQSLSNVDTHTIELLKPFPIFFSIIGVILIIMGLNIKDDL